ncbi:hypothetical protein PtA15_6A580 [Puccinia triticina]|uniref:Uncharacterized protein n=1 Tax=Puccinia triticina TaxID=208348 RepID=A0ABY7CML4_9BASI|nr:uncharacterized protein PtA15_6A580 [Puccinia triticina]WAQ85950.1 hypothetical protein PtA15_6A580 [Puccinia triticina]
MLVPPPAVKPADSPSPSPTVPPPPGPSAPSLGCPQASFPPDSANLQPVLAPSPSEPGSPPQADPNPEDDQEYLRALDKAWEAFKAELDLKYGTGP